MNLGFLCSDSKVTKINFSPLKPSTLKILVGEDRKSFKLPLLITKLPKKLVL